MKWWMRWLCPLIRVPSAIFDWSIVAIVQTHGHGYHMATCYCSASCRWSIQSIWTKAMSHGSTRWKFQNGNRLHPPCICEELSTPYSTRFDHWVHLTSQRSNQLGALKHEGTNRFTCIRWVFLRDRTHERSTLSALDWSIKSIHERAPRQRSELSNQNLPWGSAKTGCPNSTIQAQRDVPTRSPEAWLEYPLISKFDGDKASNIDVIRGIAMEAHSKRLAEHIGNTKESVDAAQVWESLAQNKRKKSYA